jgi:hypothetical protein
MRSKPPQQHQQQHQQLQQPDSPLAEQVTTPPVVPTLDPNKRIYNRRKPMLGILQDEIHHQFFTFGGSYCFPMFWIIPVSVVAKNITIILFSATTNANRPSLRNRRSGIVI